jgi:hypothetical protein
VHTLTNRDCIAPILVVDLPGDSGFSSTGNNCALSDQRCKMKEYFEIKRDDYA